MKIETAGSLQSKFKAGLSIIGENKGELEWIGTSKMWGKVGQIEVDDFDLTAEQMANDEPAW